MNDANLARKAAGQAVAAWVKPNMLVGLGTGDTAAQAIRALAGRAVPGLRCVATSLRSAELARSLGLHLVELNDLGDEMIDLTFDGADEIDPALRLIKGAGGALLYEKLVAQASRRLCIIADEAKLVTHLGEKRLLPVEIVPFGAMQTLRRIQGLFPQAVLRLAEGRPYVTDGQNHIVDVTLGGADPQGAHDRLKALTGVVETGFFLREAKEAIIGLADGTVRQLLRA